MRINVFGGRHIAIEMLCFSLSLFLSLVVVLCNNDTVCIDYIFVFVNLGSSDDIAEMERRRNEKNE